MKHTIILSEKELLFLKTCTHYELIAGVFDFENLNDAEFKHHYSLTKREVDKISKNINQRVYEKLNILNKTKNTTLNEH